MPFAPIQFGDFALDVDNYTLREGGVPVRLEKIPMDLLIFLAKREGQLVTREQIIQQLWGADVFVDAEHGINTAIRKIRIALKDDPNQPRYLQTVVGKGYRFIAPLAVPVTTNKDVKTRGRPLHSTWFFATALLLLLVLPGYFVGKRFFIPPAGQQFHSIAVLPLQNVSGDPSQDYFSDGLSDELITDLAKIHSLKVISRTSVMRYKSSKESLPQIARELGADAIVEGSVLRSGDKIRVTAQLIDAANDKHLWAENFEKDEHDVIALRSGIAAEIARRVRAALTPEEKNSLIPAHQITPQTNEAYLRGRFYWNQRTTPALQKAISYFQQAIASDPSYAAAYSGLADSYTALGYVSAIAPKDAFLPAREAAKKALALDANNAEAHCSLGYVALYYDWDFTQAENEFRTAIALSPNYVTAHEWYSVYLTAMGRSSEALREINRARELDPLSLPISTDLGFELYYSGQYDAAIKHLRSVVEIDPKFPLAHLWLGRAYEEKGMNGEASAEFELAQESLPDWPVTIAAMGWVAGTSGNRREAMKRLDRLSNLSATKYVTPYGVALVYAAVGDKNRAFEWLERAYADRSHWLVWLKLDPRWKSLHGDPRFNHLVSRIGL